MDRLQANRLLDRVRGGERLHYRAIRAALIATGDLVDHPPPRPAQVTPESELRRTDGWVECPARATVSAPQCADREAA